MRFLDGSRLHVVCNGVQVAMGFDDIFDGNVFDSLCGVAYVAGGSALSRVIQRFAHVRFLLGTRDFAPSMRFVEDFCKLQGVMGTEHFLNFWNDMGDISRNKLMEGNFEVRFARGYIVHDKIYLLSGTSSRRVVIGSSNLTATAFGGRQAELVRIFDNNDSEWSIYKKRFDELFNDGSEWVSPDMKAEAVKSRDLTINLSGPVYIVQNDTGERQIDVEAIQGFTERDLAWRVDQAKGLQLALSEQPDEIFGNVRAVLECEKQQVDAQGAMAKKILKMGKSGGIEAKGGKTGRTSAARVIVSKFCNTEKKIPLENDSHRPFLRYDSVTDRIVEVQKESGHMDVQPYSSPAPASQLRQEIEAIFDFLEPYKTHTRSVDGIDLRSRAMEAILFACEGPAVWRIRRALAENWNDVSRLAHMPVCMVIGGTAGSGKTSLLEMIGLLCGYSSRRFYEAQALRDTGAVVDAMENAFEWDNVATYLMDEIPPVFFGTTKNSGERRVKPERLMKKFSGVDTLDREYPCFIVTTNAGVGGSGEYMIMENQVKRRILYVQIDRPFLKEFRHIGFEIKKSCFEKISGYFYKDFMFRLESQIRRGLDAQSMQDDMLSIARHIFREQCTAAGVPLPKWFPIAPVDDSNLRSAKTWRGILDCYPMSVEYSGDLVRVKMHEIPIDQSEKLFLRRVLPSDVIESDSPLTLHRDRFEAMLGILPARRNRGFLQSCLSTCRKIFN